MDWIWGGAITIAVVTLATYVIGTLAMIKRRILYPVLSWQNKGLSVASQTDSNGASWEPHASRDALGHLEKGAGAMIPVEKLMKRLPITIHSTEAVQAAATLMAQHRVGSLLVEDGWGEVQGIVTETDIVRRLVAAKLSPEHATVGQIMSTPVISIEGRQPVRDADELMDRYQIRHLAVTERGKIVGIVSVRDLLHPMQMECRT